MVMEKNTIKILKITDEKLTSELSLQTWVKTWSRGTERSFPLEVSLSLPGSARTPGSDSIGGCGSDFYTEPPYSVWGLDSGYGSSSRYG